MKAGSILDGKYELRRRIGEGAMGVVWEGINTRTEREVAVKLMLSAGRDQDRQRLLREARAGGRIRHPNVLDVYDVSETDTGSPFIVMELLRGETLAHRLARGPLSLEQALRILRDVARGLAAAHKVGVVHRDLKPRNVYLHDEPDTKVPTVKLVEFGISRIDAEATLTLNGVTLGSPGYVAPEQIDGRSVDKRADIWAFGALAYELVTGKPLFDGGTPAEIVQQVTGSPIPDLPAVAHEVDSDLRKLVAGCLIRDPDRRFPSIEDCGAIAERLLKRVRHPSMVALAEMTPRPRPDDDEPTAVTRRRGPRTLRMGTKAQAPADADDAVTRLKNDASPMSDPDTITDVVITLRTPPVTSLESDETPRRGVTQPLREADLRAPESEGSEETRPTPIASSPPPSGPRTVADPPTFDDGDRGPPESDPPTKLASSPPGAASSPPGAPSSPPGAVSEPPPYDPGTLSTRALELFRQTSADEKVAAAARARQKRVSRIGLAVVVLVGGGIGVAVLSRLTSGHGTPSSPTSPSETPATNESGAPASSSTELAAPPAPTPTATDTPEDTSASPASSSSATPPASASAAASSKPKVPGGNQPPRPPPPAPPPPNDGTFNPTTL